MVALQHPRLSKIFLLILSLLFAFWTIGCTSTQKTKESKNSSKVLVLEKQVLNLKKELKDLKLENKTLNAIATESRSEAVLESTRLNSLLKRMGTVPTVIENESILYRRVIAAYDEQDPLTLKNLVDLHQRAFPKGLFLDGSFYLQGQLLVLKGKLSEALTYFNTALANFPQTQRRPQLLLAKANIYKKLNLPLQAQEMIENLKSESSRKTTVKTSSNEESLVEENESKLSK